MQVFKLFFHILKRNIGIVIMYVAIFLGVAIGVTSAQSATGTGVSSDEVKLTISIIDQDQKTIGAAMKEYFGKGNELVEMAYDEKAIADKLYWRDLDYVLVIPEGFEESLTDDEEGVMELKCMKVPGYFDASFFETDLNLYITKLGSLLSAGYSMEEAQEMLMELQTEETKVEVAEFINENQNDWTTMFLNFVPYLFISLAIYGIGTILLVFNAPLVKARMECGAMSMKKRLLGLAAGIAVYGAAMFALVIVVAGIASKGALFTDVRFPYFLINMAALLLFSLSLGFFVGTVAKNANTLNGFVNIFSIGLCFIGGVFVPMQFFGEDVLKVARFFPTYWYAKTNTEIGAMTSEFAGDLLGQIGIIAAYALAFFAVTIMIIAGRRKKK